MPRRVDASSHGIDQHPGPHFHWAQKLFRPRSWGEMAESETYAHLEHLRLAGAAAVRRDGEGFLVYETG